MLMIEISEPWLWIIIALFGVHAVLSAMSMYLRILESRLRKSERQQKNIRPPKEVL